MSTAIPPRAEPARPHRILTTHTGSLPRPAELTRLYASRAHGEPIDMGQLEELGRAALRHAVHQQIETGIDIGNNGEQQREGFFLYLRNRLTGLGGSWTRKGRADVARYPMFGEMQREQIASKVAVSGRDEIPMAIGEVRYADPQAIAVECEDFRVALAGEAHGFVQPFMSAPSPGIVVASLRNQYYDTEDAYLAAVGAALQIEYETIVGSGFLLQIDAPDLALERHITYQDQPLSDFLGFAERVVDTINTALRNIPSDRVRMHVCWGNYEGPHDCDVPLAEVLPAIAQTKVGGLVLPFANPRHAHEYRELKALRDDQHIVAGVIDPLTNIVEHPEVVADRLEHVAAALGGPDRLVAGTDCGFDSRAGAGRVAADVVWAKLGSLVEGARIASERLYAP